MDFLFEKVGAFYTNFSTMAPEFCLFPVNLSLLFLVHWTMVLCCIYRAGTLTTPCKRSLHRIQLFPPDTGSSGVGGQWYYYYSMWYVNQHNERVVVRDSWMLSRALTCVVYTRTRYWFSTIFLFSVTTELLYCYSTTYRKKVTILLIRITGLRRLRRPGRPLVAGSRDVAKDGRSDEMPRVESALHTALPENERDFCCSCTGGYLWSHNGLQYCCRVG